MNNVSIQKTLSTPSLEFDVKKGELLVEGRSIPENPGDYYEPLVELVKNYFSQYKGLLKIDFKLEYVNSGSSKYILGLFKLLDKEFSSGKKCQVNWHYEEDDESVFELGEHYKNSFRFPFNLVEFL